MNTINRTETFTAWLAGLKDLKARAKIVIHIRQASQGNLGDVKPISDGVWEMRIHFGWLSALLCPRGPRGLPSTQWRR
ncbi:hypothetical protein [Pusillimonas caeni]|uniref:type II toxin-antitoxin system RelE/ParE family toxin n=1 Tax=Pusillimonas caeni TaxID=1348472 RepID=UPI0031582EA0